MTYLYKVITKNNREYIISCDKEMTSFIRAIFGESTNSIMISTWGIANNEEITGVILISTEVSTIEMLNPNIDN